MRTALTVSRARLQDESLVVSLIQRHLKYTGSAVARAILNDWDAAKANFVKVFPHEYARALKEVKDAEVRCLLPLYICLLCPSCPPACSVSLEARRLEWQGHGRCGTNIKAPTVSGGSTFDI